VNPVQGGWSGNPWMQVLTKYGVVGGIAAYLVWLLGTQFITGQTAINKQLLDGQAALTRDLLQHQTEQRFYLRAICLNVARDEAGRALCDPR
jgi:hypothetical protein